MFFTFIAFCGCSLLDTFMNLVLFLLMISPIFPASSLKISVVLFRLSCVPDIKTMSFAYAVNAICFPCPIFNTCGSLCSILLTTDSNAMLIRPETDHNPVFTVNSSDIAELNLTLHLEFSINAFTILTSLASIPN